MGLGEKALGGQHGHITRPRLYEFVAGLGFLGLRPQVYDGLVRASGAQPGERVLDVGCGTGYFARRAALAVGPTGRVVGIDPSEPMVRHARRLAPSNCEFHVAGAEAIPEPDASFDLAISSLAIHHIPHELRPAAMAELFRLVRPSGRVLVADFRPPRGALASHLVGALTGHAMRHNPVGELASLLTGAGFTITGSGDRRPMLHYVTAARA
jgi:ubiquinone/menaquinone biosynthesis C-methylase UbiE